MTSETYRPRIGGAEIHVENLVNGLIDTGHNLTLITNEASNDQSPSNFEVIRLPWTKRNAFKLFYLIWTKSKDVQIIHSHYSYRMGMVAGMVGKLRGKPVVVTLHGMGILDPTHARGRKLFLHKLYRYWSLRLATKVVSTSEDLANFAYKYIDRSKVVIIPNGYDATIFNSSVETPVVEKLKRKFQHQKVILTVRRLVHKNGIQFMVESMPLIKKELKEAVLVVLGEGPLLNYLRNRSVELGVGDDVHFEGFKTSNEVAEYLKIADVVVFPSTAESASLACVEAMAMGKKIVASRVGGLVELIGKNDERGTLVQVVDWEQSNYDAPMSVPKENLERLSNAVVKVLASSPEIEGRALSAKGYASENLSWGSICALTVNVYKEELINNA